MLESPYFLDRVEMIKGRISALDRNPVNSYEWYGWINSQLEGPKGTEKGRGILRIGKTPYRVRSYKLDGLSWWQRLINPKKKIGIPEIWWATNYWLPEKSDRTDLLAPRYATNLRIPGGSVPTISQVSYRCDEIGRIIICDDPTRVATVDDLNFFTSILLENQLDYVPPRIPKDVFGLAELGYLE